MIAQADADPTVVEARATVAASA